MHNAFLLEKRRTGPAVADSEWAPSMREGSGCGPLQLPTSMSDTMTRRAGRGACRRASCAVAFLAVVFAAILCFPSMAFADDPRVIYTDDIWSIWDEDTAIVEADSSDGALPVPDGPPSSSESVDQPESVDQAPASNAGEPVVNDNVAPAGNAGSDDQVLAVDDSSSQSAPDDCVTPVEQPQEPIPDSTVTTTSQTSEHPYDPTSVLVQISPNSTPEQLDAIIDDARNQGLSLSCDDVTPTDLGYGSVRLTVSGSSVDDAISMLAQVKGVIAAQPNYIYTVEAGDAQIVDQAALTRVDDKLTNDNWVANAIHAFEAWDLVKVNGSLAVAVIDTGADLDHPDLADRIVASYNSSDEGLSAEDEFGHGTHVAGIIAGTANNGVGLAGVSYNANLVVIKASAQGKNSFESAAIVRAYAWLLEQGLDGLTNAQRYGVRVINMSIGGKDDTITANQADDEITRAIVAARDAGILTVCAAGNKGSDADPYLTYPGDADACLAVMNLAENPDGGYELAATSNYNLPGTAYKDVCAPGSTIYSTWTQGRYAIQSGTSMAAPVVSGIAALMFAVNPDLTPEMVMGLIEDSCSDLGDAGWDERYGYGLVDAQASVLRALAFGITGPAELGIGSAASHAYEIASPSGVVALDGWTWTTSPDSDSAYGAGSAVVDAFGRVSGLVAGDVIVRASRTAANGAEIAVTRNVRVVDDDISVSGVDILAVGESFTFALLDPYIAGITPAEATEGAAGAGSAG